VENPFSEPHEPSKGGEELWAIARLAEPVGRLGDHFVRAVNGLVKTIRPDWYRPIGACGGQNGQSSHDGDVQFGRIKRTALRPVALREVRKIAASRTEKRKEWRESGVCKADPGKRLTWTTH
jgi:hypothetical protein